MGFLFSRGASELKGYPKRVSHGRLAYGAEVQRGWGGWVGRSVGHSATCPTEITNSKFTHHYLHDDHCGVITCVHLVRFPIVEYT